MGRVSKVKEALKAPSALISEREISIAYTTPDKPYPRRCPREARPICKASHGMAWYWLFRRDWSTKREEGKDHAGAALPAVATARNQGPSDR